MEITFNFYPKFNNLNELRGGNEKYDSSLNRLNSVLKFTEFCDSVYGLPKISTQDSGKYANLVTSVIQYRFMHGYTWYNFGHNFTAKLIAPLLHKNLSAIVVPDDILKYPFAACSQQSIVGMKILLDKGYDVRRVGFYDSTIGGHFCYEVKYNNSWHFYDPNKEPDQSVLNSRNRPSIQYLNEHPDLLIMAYPNSNKNHILPLFKTYKVGGEGKLPGGNARLFQQLTKFLSYSLWIFLGLIYFYVDKRFFHKK